MMLQEADVMSSHFYFLDRFPELPYAGCSIGDFVSHGSKYFKDHKPEGQVFQDEIRRWS